MRKVYYCLFSLLLSMLCLQAQEDKFQTLQQVLHQLSDDGLFHGTVLVAENNQIQFHQSFGRHPESKEPLTTKTPVDIASISKPLTAAGIMMLASKGKLNLDAPVKEFIWKFPFPDITIRHLLNQTSGMDRFLPSLLKYWDTHIYIDNDEILKVISLYPPKSGQPGVSFQYNNANYTMLASIIESVSDMDYVDFMEKKVFRTYKMKHTQHRSRFVTDPPPANADNFMDFDKGSGNILSTAEDLFHFTRQVYSGKKIDEQVRKEAFKPGPLSGGQEGPYGFGWFLETKPELQITHRGEGHQVSAGIKYIPGTGKMIIVLHPYSNIYFNKVYEVIENIIARKDYSLPQKRAIVQVDDERLQKYVGQYDSQFGLIHITLEAGKLYLRPDPIPGKEELIPSSETTFYFGDQDLEWEFFLDDKGDVVGLGMKGQPATLGKKQ